MQSLRGNGRAVIVIDPRSVTAAQLDRLHAQGVRGLRINLNSALKGDIRGISDELALHCPIAQQMGWHLELVLPFDALVCASDLIAALPVQAVIDHFACRSGARRSRRAAAHCCGCSHCRMSGSSCPRPIASAAIRWRQLRRPTGSPRLSSTRPIAAFGAAIGPTPLQRASNDRGTRSHPTGASPIATCSKAFVQQCRATCCSAPPEPIQRSCTNFRPASETTHWRSTKCPG